MAEPTSVKIVSSAVLVLSTASARTDPIGTANPGQPGLTLLVRVACAADVWLAIGAGEPTAAVDTVGSFLMTAGVEYFDVPAGHRIAAVLGEDAGMLSISICTKS